MSGPCVYFIQADHGPIKIGFTSDDPKRRLAQLQTGNPSALRLLGAVSATSAREKQFHSDLAEWRLQGEWFEPHPNVLAAVQSALDAPSDAPCDGPHCSFCGVCRHYAAVLVAAPQEGVFICEQCVGACATVASEHFAKAAEAMAAAPGQRGQPC